MNCIKFFGKERKKQELHKKEEVDEILKNIKDAKYIVEEIKLKEKMFHLSFPSLL